jgi:ssDNA-binding Zn-finger/Zn-ribbon topoisomerase 1
MTISQDSETARRCPRCGGRLYKPLGSSLYWHADSNHPPCDITNIAESSFRMQAAEERPAEQREKRGEKQ